MIVKVDGREFDTDCVSVEFDNGHEVRVLEGNRIHINDGVDWSDCPVQTNTHVLIEQANEGLKAAHRRIAAELLEKDRRRAADEAFENYDFEGYCDCD